MRTASSELRNTANFFSAQTGALADLVAFPPHIEIHGARAWVKFMECLHCKKVIADGSMFCNFCGTKQVVAQEANVDEMATQIQNILGSITGYRFNEHGLLRCKKWIKEFGFDIVCDSVETALEQYLVEDNEGNYTKESIDEVFSKIGGIAKNKHTALTKPYIFDIKRIINYINKSFYINYYEMEGLAADLNNLLYFFFSAKQYDGKVEDILALVRGSKDKYEFFDKVKLLKETYDID